MTFQAPAGPGRCSTPTGTWTRSAGIRRWAEGGRRSSRTRKPWHDWRRTITWAPKTATSGRRPVEAHPTETFYSDGETLIDGERIEYGHLLQAHTDGDIYVYFRDANALAAGDAVSPAGDPQLDWFGGGWLGGRVEALEKILQMSDAETRIVPGHGPVVGRAEVQAEFEMCLVLFDRMLEMIRTGMSAQDMLDDGLFAGINRTLDDPLRFAYDAYKGFWAHHNTLAADVL